MWEHATQRKKRCMSSTVESELHLLVWIHSPRLVLNTSDSRKKAATLRKFDVLFSSRSNAQWRRLNRYIENLFLFNRTGSTRLLRDSHSRENSSSVLSVSLKTSVKCIFFQTKKMDFFKHEMSRSLTKTIRSSTERHTCQEKMCL